MKCLVKIVLLMCLAVFVTGCKTEAKDKLEVSKAVVEANLKTVNLSIDGMTCEIGCAKTIESKISKIKGVASSKVNFEAKKGTFTYDSIQTSKTEIIKEINGLLDGKTYTANLLAMNACKPGCEKGCCADKKEKTCRQGCEKPCCAGKEKKECKGDVKKACCATKK